MRLCATEFLIQMHCERGMFEVRSAGPDAALDTDDDIFASEKLPW
jgi:hypothetical protein